jgi:hypothetical protein
MLTYLRRYGRSERLELGQFVRVMWSEGIIPRVGELPRVVKTADGAARSGQLVT